MCAGVDGVLGLALAGGAGTRVGGEDKGLLPLSGRPMVEHVLDHLRTQCERVLIVANRNLDRYASYAPTIHDEALGHAGPLAGLIAAFGFLDANRHALPRWLLTVSIDCPDAPRDLAARLHAALAARDATRCAYARIAGKPQPLFALYRIGGGPLTWKQSAQAALREHGSPWRWHTSLNAIAVDFGDGVDAFHNLNTLEDFRDYERTHD
ncbi:MAG: molybdenum cofactor guanylyltransferase MobA [Rhodanobacteraceae bacterium]|nr:MAG: molybdenum cofactor guanylyltransferase MobA [Rhodanobacteraceae bacterium]